MRPRSRSKRLIAEHSQFCSESQHSLLLDWHLDVEFQTERTLFHQPVHCDTGWVRNERSPAATRSNWNCHIRWDSSCQRDDHIRTTLTWWTFIRRNGHRGSVQNSGGTRAPSRRVSDPNFSSQPRTLRHKRSRGRRPTSRKRAYTDQVQRKKRPEVYSRGRQTKQV